MLSVCIPIYKHDVRPLVHELHKQATALMIQAEILLLDDGSPEDTRMINRELQELPLVKYEELQENAGRSKIRNLLQKRASFRYLLILDCDLTVIRQDYLAQYSKLLHEGAVICGGRIYGDKPADPQYLLHWHVGSKREVATTRQRQANPHHNFITGNFVIDRQVFEKICFDEALSGYGHEDTLFGYELMKRDIPVIHIDNPLVHEGLEPAEQFLAKTREGLQNLLITWNLVHHDPRYAQMVRILKIYLRLRRLGMHKLAASISNPLENFLLQNLTGKKPNTILFDIYKLCLLCRLSMQRNR